MSDDVTIDIDFDDQTMIIIPSSGKSYVYSLDEISNDLVDRLITGNTNYTVYSQGERYTEDQLSREEILNAIHEEEITTTIRSR
jgi:hypothetical protein